MLRQLFSWIVIATLVGAAIVASWTRVIWVGQQGVLFTRRGGKNRLVPGPHFIGPGARISRVSTRIRVLDVTDLQVVTSDRQTVRMDVAVLAGVRAAEFALDFRDHVEAATNVACAAVRAVVATRTLDDLVFEGETVQEAISAKLRAWMGEPDPLGAMAVNGARPRPDWGLQIFFAAIKRVSRPEGPVFPTRPRDDAARELARQGEVVQLG
jgi:regulator of protease activity HflC (stomatin/prohibitin superfamily)